MNLFVQAQYCDLSIHRGPTSLHSARGLFLTFNGAWHFAFAPLKFTSFFSNTKGMYSSLTTPNFKSLKAQIPYESDIQGRKSWVDSLPTVSCLHRTQHFPKEGTRREEWSTDRKMEEREAEVLEHDREPQVGDSLVCRESWETRSH